MCVRCVAKCPPARVAIQPPSVDSSNDCGKKRSVSPCAASCSSIRGPLAPAPMRAARETASTSRTRVDRPEVDRDRAVEAVGHARLDAADDARAAAVRDDGRVRGAGPLEDVLDLARVARARDDVGHVRVDAAQAVDGVEVGLAAGVRGAGARGRPCRSREVRRATRRAAAGSAVGSNGDGLLGLGLAEAEQPDERRARPRAHRAVEIAASSKPQPQRLRTRMRAGPYPQGADADRSRHPRPRPVGARGTCRRAGATSTTRRRPTGRGGRCRHRGAARAWLAEPRRPRRPARRPRGARRRARARPAAAALGAAPRRGRRVVFGRRDVPDPRQRGPLARGPAGDVAVLVGGALGARRGRRGRGRREPGADAGARARGGVVGGARAPARSRRSSASPTTS